jgi:hypothetical protein
MAPRRQADGKWRPLTDEQLAAIAWADPAETSLALARRLGRHRETVASFRRRLAELGGWGCPLTWSSCEGCGRPPSSGPQRTRRFHPACWAERRKDTVRIWTRNRARRWWHARTPAECSANVAAVRARTDRAYQATRPRADRHRLPWTEDDDAALTDHHGGTLEEIALALGRTVFAVRDRRVVLRERGVLPPARADRGA